MPTMLKDKSPFFPGQPVPVDFFVGRLALIQRLMQRGVGQVEAGKPIAIYIQGEYGIGKSSIAGFIQALAERQHHLHGIYAPLGNAETLDHLGAVVLEATLRSGAFDLKREEKIRNWLAKYIGEQSFFGINLHAEALKKDAPTIAFGLLPFLQEVMNRVQDTGVKGIFLVLDEINGITTTPKFSHLIKGLVDTNALSRNPLPLLLMLCGVEERRRDMIRHHQPVERIFDVVEIEPMSADEMEIFFNKTFARAQISVEPEAMAVLTKFSAGFPKIMHLIGDAAFWRDNNGVISKEDALYAVIDAAEEVGKKYVDQQVYKALRSKDYHSILAKIAKMGPDVMSFNKSEVASGLALTEKKKFDNFLQKMKALKVIRSGDVQGEYVFNMTMVRLYIWLQSSKKADRKA